MLIIQNKIVGENLKNVLVCCSTDYILIIQRILVGWKFETCPYMSIYAAVWWYVDNSKDFSGITIWKMSIYVHVCPFMLQYGDILIIQTKITGVKNWKMSIYVHLCCSMGDMLIIQMGRKHMSTKWGYILSGVAFEFNCIIGKTHILCGRGTLYIYTHM